MGNRLIHRKSLLQQDQLGVHGAGRGIRVEIEQIAQFLGIFLGQLFQQDVAVLLIQFVQHVGGVVRRHFGDDLGGHVGVQIFQHVHGHVAVQLGQGLGGILRGHVAQGADLLFQAQIFQMIGHVRRMDELGLVAHLPADLGHADAVRVAALRRVRAFIHDTGGADFVVTIVSHEQAFCRIRNNET